MTLFSVHDLSKRYGARVLFEGVSFSVSEGERIGIVGVNGSGKSSLLKMLAGQVSFDSGDIALRRGARVGYLSQEPELNPAHTLREEAEEGLAPLKAALAAHSDVSARLGHGAHGEGGDALLAELDRITLEIERLGGWDLSHRVEGTLTPLGLEDLERPVSGLSGGERKRLALGKVLLEAPDLLLLDEPTNHLDADTVEWLEKLIPNYRGAILLVTHDRYFLDNTVHRILEVAEGGLIPYPGSYEAYLEGKAERLSLAKTTKDRRLSLLRTELAWLRRGPKARGTKAQARIDRVHAMQDQSEVTDESTADLFFTKPDRMGKIILEAKDLTYAIEDRTLIDGFSLKMHKGERYGILGPNGSGKTTLLRILLGRLEPDSGEVRHGQNTTFAYFDQMRGDLDEDRTVTETLCEGNDWVLVGGVDGEKVHVVTYLNRFLFPPETHRQPVSMLSGGERNRLILAKLMTDSANVIVLDEPTNDLDLLTLQALEAAMARFPGCVLVVTHDRSFLNKVATSILAFEGEGQITEYVGNYDTYRALKAQSAARNKEEAKVAKAAQREIERAETPAAPPAPPKRKRSWNEERELEALPGKIEALEEEKAAIEARLGDPALYTEDPGAVTGLTQDLARLEGELAKAYERWEMLEGI